MIAYSPSRQEATSLALSHPECNMVPVYRDVPADLETPVSAYLKVRQGRHSFLLESVEGGEQLARHSFIGVNPIKVFKSGPGEAVQGDPLGPFEEQLKDYRPVKVLGLPPFSGGAVGYISYDCVRYFEPTVPVPETDSLGIPESYFVFSDSIVVFDHVRHTMRVVTHLYYNAGVSEAELAAAYDRACAVLDDLVGRLTSPDVPLPPPHTAHAGDAPEVQTVDQAAYEGMVHKLQQHIVAGDIIQAVPSRRIIRPSNIHPFNLYRELRMVNPSPYMFFLDLDTVQVIGASPELLVKSTDGKLITVPIAGTRARGKTPEEDQALEEDLLSDEKERAEHIMLVDLGRNDIGRIAKPGSVQVASMMQIARYSHVMHIVSEVVGELRDDKTPMDALRSVFPAGTVSGAPKIRAMQLIASLEPQRRNIYAGAVGYFSFSGDMDTCIAIRTMVYKDGKVYSQSGGGIVFDSKPYDEYIETVNKLGSSKRAIDLAEARVEEHQHRAAKRRRVDNNDNNNNNNNNDPRPLWARD